MDANAVAWIDGNEAVARVAYTRPRLGHKGTAMRILLSAILLSLLAACGQTGPLYLPDGEIDTEVEIRPGPPPPAGASDTGPAAGPEGRADDEDAEPSARPEQAPG